MTLTPSKRFNKITSAGFTPTGGSLVALTGIQSVSQSQNAQVLKGSGDGDSFNTFVGVIFQDPTVSFESNEPALMNAVAAGAFGTLTWTENDARNGAQAGGGALIYTVTNAVFNPQARSVSHLQLGTNTYSFECQSSDGATNPVSYTAA